MFVAIMESEHYSWMALGNTEEQAMDAIREAWNKHQRGVFKRDGDFEMLSFETNEDLNNYYGIWVEELKPGQCKWQ